MSIIGKISRIITDKLFNDTFSTNMEMEWISFAIEAILGGIITTGVMILISIITNSLICLLLFHIFFVPLRQYTGGYHEKTHLRCLISTNAIYLFSVAIKNIASITLFFPMYIVEIILGIIVIYLYCPVRNENKILEDAKVPTYKLYSILIFLIENILVYLIYIVSPIYAIYTTNILNIVIVLIIIGTITERRKNYE